MTPNHHRNMDVSIEKWLFRVPGGKYGWFFGKFSTLEIECIKKTQHDLKVF